MDDFSRRDVLRLASVFGMTSALAPLGTSTATAADGAVANGAHEYSLKIDPTRRGPTISDTMYGIFYEDINRAADGGLYAELVQNRSFEYSSVDNSGYTPLTAWSTVSTGGASGTAEVVDDAERLNEHNRHYLRLSLDGSGDAAGTYGVVNSGYNSGMFLESGKKYDFSVWARTDQARGTTLTVSPTDESGASLAAKPLRVELRGDRWSKYTGTFVARASSTTGRLTVAAGGAGTVRLDMVSLFPRDTFMNRPNGMRRDLAEKIAALRPSFLRFPGGCIVNTGSMYPYRAPDWPRARSYQWKDTIGPVERRATNANFWGYNQSYGLGYYEYFQFAEDIGAMPLPVVPSLVTGCGQNHVTEDPELLRQYVRDTLDLIEFANGSATTPWGRKRAEMGHPKPFGLTHIGIGNEEPLVDEYFERFLKFRRAVESAHPEVTVISNSGPDDSGPVFDRAWELGRSADVGMIDEHYYNDPEWFLTNNDRYDSYDRKGPKVFLGEYASEGNRFYNSLAEAAYMTGLERNADIVRLTSYAPLLANEDYVQWEPDMIWFDNATSWGSTSYETQKLFMNNIGDEVVPSTASSTPVPSTPITGSVGLSTWATSVAYDDVAVTSADGSALFGDDFSGEASQWRKTGERGSWSVSNGAYVQHDTSAENTLVIAGDSAWSDYDLHVRATKRSGSEGFLVAFGVTDADNYYWWNLGGWGNTRSVVEKATDGVRRTLVGDDTSIETGREYDLRIEIRGRRVALFLDGRKWGEFTDDKIAEPFRQVVTHDRDTGELIVKVVNAQDAVARSNIDLGRQVRVSPVARLTTLQGDPDAVNTADAQPIRPRQSTLPDVSNSFTHVFPAHSITFMRIRVQSA
ncbi:alpha-L-arabinofuranosidase [Saccharopolyspora lacisalsi]|uniref:non-reducing end alpha-L-arabinofuranosidase n=1 Tax=Halosaccharopolyspora lacisalsi TaxID=1000566 RepID=A0A839DX20_9PSEU|nr:alpha-L-arabinofuranosidase C-terminal domain-containing protein [Halosaccharopolyspora lacisalsi]MBA8823751.1 alpha-L-arabinofuranosidase [Halosaccharopolyspora lacisalsi]